MDVFNNYVGKNMRRVWVHTCREKEKEGMGGDGSAARECTYSNADTARMPSLRATLDAHSIRTRTECDAKRHGTWYLVPAALDSRGCGTMRDEGDGEHRACGLAASRSRVERGWGMESDGEGEGGWVERNCVEDAPAGAGARA
ncbi:hypothetical protein C8F04DRAFT_1198062 [Mycena alexandri]|uniref:Uncharacterized protein n=1 Tax=Mycena alexandri TaxID=1745969 RepID=A0AAD6S1C8_9AGAR|nr:hypothetical protein C8F04DRAFT_1198062 [Mycena alexandri]